MLRLLYTIILHLYTLGAVWRFVFWPKGRPFWSWFGQGAPGHRTSKTVVWVHAVSVGEVRAISGLIQRLKERSADAQIVVTTTTATGQQEARQVLHGVDHIFYLPLDLPWVIRPIVRRIAPDLLLVSETDLWLHFLDAAKQQGAQIHLVNGKLSARSFRAWLRFRSLFHSLYGLLDGLALQDSVYRDRFIALGVSEQKICVTGNLKLDLDRLSIVDCQGVARRLKIASADMVVVLGSTHATEEQLLIEQLIGLQNLKVIVVPRHPERFEEVAGLIAAFGFPWGRWTEAEALTGEEHFLLVDAMGQLNACYGLATLAIVGGSFVKNVGGHNIMEPLIHGAAVLFGPYMHNQESMRTAVVQTGAGRQIEGSQVGETVSQLLATSSALEQMVSKGKGAITQMQGALERTWKSLPLKRISLNAKLGPQMTRGGAEVSSLGS